MLKGNRIYIVGAGKFGRSIANEIQASNYRGKLEAFFDDDRSKIGTLINDIPVLGPIEVCTKILDGSKDEAIIAIPSASRTQLNNIHNCLVRANFDRIRILPSVSQMVTADAHFIQAREMDPQDLLGREPVLIDLKESLSYVRNKRVLITGAGGSIGSELSRQLLHGGAERLYLLGHGENSIWGIQKELEKLQVAGVGEKAVIVPIIGEMQDADYIHFLLGRLKAHVIFHGAAHKHVPMLETNPIEAVKNNVFVTKNLVDAAIDAHTERFVLISTDKAVEPTSIYGASKKLAEMIVLANQNAKTHFKVVRFGNVLGSRGSIMPLFKEQISSGGPVTVTHPDARRWFMTIPEAVSLILKTGGLEQEDGLYLLDMGEPVRIIDFARQMIKFYGYEEESIPIQFTGMRPGEKKTEKLWSNEEEPLQTTHERIIQVKTPCSKNTKIQEMLNALKPVVFRQENHTELYRSRHALWTILNQYFPTVGRHESDPEY